MKQTLYLMLGYPGSGKSYFSTQLALKIGAIRFNSDHLRKHLFDDPKEHDTVTDYQIVLGSFAYAARAALKAGHPVICDANYNFIKDRVKYAEIARELGVDTIIIWIRTPLENAIQRGQTRVETSEQVKITASHVQKLASSIETPCPISEKCIEIDGTMDFETQFAQFKRQLRKLRTHKK